MRPLLLAFSLALTACTTAPDATPSAFPPSEDSLAMLKARVDDGRATGIVLGVMDADGSSRVVAYGNPGPGAPALDANSVIAWSPRVGRTMPAGA